MGALNLTLFAKVVALARSRPHVTSAHADAERETAWAKAESMAAHAGLSLDAALSTLDASETQGASGAHESNDAGFEEWAQRWAERSRKQRAGKRRAAARRRAEAGHRAWNEHPGERALREALKGHDIADMGTCWEELSADTLQVIRATIVWPTTMEKALAEETIWNRIEASRRREEPNYRLEDGPYIRRALLREFLEGEAQTPEEMVARAKWLATRGEREILFEREAAHALQTVTGDLERMFGLLNEARAKAAEHPSTVDAAARETNRDKQARVRAILEEPGGTELSLRELARRAGVSVQGAANIKRTMTGGGVKG